MAFYGTMFGDKHTYRDWGLLPKTRATISAPEAKIIEKNLTGADDVIELTKSITPDVKFNRRTYSQEFIVLDARAKWWSIYSTILNYLQGQSMKMVLDEDPSFYYYGRFKVNEWKSDKAYSVIALEGNINAYKYETTSSTEDWLWDTFNFEDGIIRDYRNIEINGEYTLVILGRRKRVIPVFTCTAPLTVTYNGQSYDLPVGERKVTNIALGEGNHELIFRGHGVVTVEYRGASL